PAADQCLYRFTMTELIGEGWNAKTMEINQNGVTVATSGSTCTNGNSATVQVPLCNGVAFELFWNTTGFFATEVGVSITSFLGETIFTHPTGSNLQGTTLYQGTGECIAPTCLKPTNVLVTSDLDSVTVSWTENNTPPVGQWEVIILPAGSPPPVPTDTGI